MNLETLRNIYNHLQDEESRVIFEKRLLYSITDEYSHIRDMLFKICDFDKAREGIGRS